MMDPPLAYDSDEEPPPESWGDGLLWRLDPAESFSDFTIEVSSTADDPAQDGGERIDVYHVHRSTIALGPRGGEYFAHLLQGTFAEASAGVCRVSLDALAAQAFPRLLDYVYGAPQLACSTDSATALHYLGDYFRMPRLRMQARQFWTTNLCLENCATYYRHAVIFCDDRILQRVQDLAAQRFMEIPLESELFQVIDPPFLLRILQTAEVSADMDHRYSRHASQLVAQVLENQRLETSEDTEDIFERAAEPMEETVTVSPELFLQLTDVDRLPEIDCDAAFKLLHMEHMLLQPHPDTLTSLQQRCVQSLGKRWKYTRMTPSFMNNLRQHVSPIFLTELLAHSWTCAKEAITTKHAEINALHAKSANLDTALQQAHGEVNRLRAEKRHMHNHRYHLSASNQALTLRVQELQEELAALQSGSMPYSMHDDLENRLNSMERFQARKRAATGTVEDPIDAYDLDVP